MISLNSIKDQASDFLKRAFAELDRKDFALEKHWQIDHLCYRTATDENYLSIKKQFETFSKLLIETRIRGLRAAIVDLS